MKLYEANGGQFYGTQADAKAAVGKGNFTEVDVPTDKYGLIAYLNNLTLDVVIEAAGGENPIIEYNNDFIHSTVQDIEPKADTRPLERLIKVERNIKIEDEIANADFPTALRLAQHATSRVGEHLKDLADARFPKPASGYAGKVDPFS